MIALSIQNLHKVYSNQKIALYNINLSIDEGDFFALLGQNGAGKSTTIGIVSSLITKSAGKIAVFNYDLDHNLTQAKSMLGVVPQELNFSIFEKISHTLINQAGYYGIPRKIARQRMEKYLTEMGLWEMREQPAIKLSGGMKRRLMIARALITEPRLLILDEPTAGVDIELRHSLWKFLLELNRQGTTIILTTHYLEEAEHLCRNIAIIHQGNIIEKTSMKELISRLDVQTFIIECKTPITNTQYLVNYTHRLLDEYSLEIEVRRDQSITELFHLIALSNIAVTSLRNKTNRLEELYIKLIASKKND